TKAEPRNGRVWMMLAQTYGRRKNAAQAGVAALKAAGAGASDPVVLQGLAFLYREIVPDVGRAAAYQQRYAEVADGDRGAWTVAAQLWSAAGKFAEAQTASEKALARNPYEEQSYFLLAQAHLARLDFAGAVKVLEDGRRTFDKSVQLELAYGVALYGQRRFPEAVTAFLRAMDLDPDVPQPYSFLGKMLEHAEDRLPELVKRFGQYEVRHPDDALGYLLHGKALAAQLPPAGFPPAAEEAQKLIEKSLTLDENGAEAHYELGCLLERRRDFAAAATHLERSAALNGKLAETHYHLARVYDRMGRGEEAAAERALHEKLNAKTRDAASDVRLR
ncbi:MAG: tetratricopeptide repeat protein, partial [Bryobacteraceae bacterium]